jgi:hypothetical protein
MVLALYRTSVVGGGGHKDFIVVMGAKLLNCRILLCTRMWVGGIKRKEGQTASKSEISELSSNCGSLRCLGTILVWTSFWISYLCMYGTSYVPFARLGAALVSRRVCIVLCNLMSVCVTFRGYARGTARNVSNAPVWCNR